MCRNDGIRDFRRRQFNAFHAVRVEDGFLLQTLSSLTVQRITDQLSVQLIRRSFGKATAQVTNSGGEFFENT